MVPYPFGLHILGRVYRRRRVHHARRVHRRRNLNFRNLTTLTQIVRKRQVTLTMTTHTQFILEWTFTARDIAEGDDDLRTSFDCANSALTIVMDWHRGLQREIRQLEASVARMKEKYRGGNVEVYSIEQMEAVEYLHGIGWRGNISNPTENRVIAGMIARLSTDAGL